MLQPLSLYIGPRQSRRLYVLAFYGGIGIVVGSQVLIASVKHSQDAAWYIGLGGTFAGVILVLMGYLKLGRARGSILGVWSSTRALTPQEQAIKDRAGSRAYAVAQIVLSVALVLAAVLDVLSMRLPSIPTDSAVACTVALLWGLNLLPTAVIAWTEPNSSVSTTQ